LLNSANFSGVFATSATHRINLSGVGTDLLAGGFWLPAFFFDGTVYLVLWGRSNPLNWKQENSIDVPFLRNRKKDALKGFQNAANKILFYFSAPLYPRQLYSGRSRVSRNPL
jgi:hypothetical protein